MKFKIVADASCDLPKEIMEKYDITIIPIEVMFGEEVYPETSIKIMQTRMMSSSSP